MIEILLQRGSWSRNILFCFTAVAIIALLLHVKLTVSLGGCHHTTYHPALNLIFFSGLHGLELVNLHVVRHIGLHDIRVVAQVVTDLQISGQYELSGKGLSMIDLTGSGALNISVTRLLLTGETFLVLQENKETRDTEVFIKNVDMKMNNEKVSVELENILGGGLLGDMANNILTLIGEEFLYAHKDMLTKRVSEKFKEKFSQIITMPNLSNVAQ